jgi:hypothetical protein
MKGLILHCRKFSFKDIENSTKPAGISEVLVDRELTEGFFEEQSVILTCIEESDTEEIVLKATEHVNHMVKEWHGGNTNLIVLPFGHLSRAIARPPKSKDLIDMFVRQLQRGNNRVELITFGSHKEWMVDVYGYPRATSWFEF